MTTKITESWRIKLSQDTKELDGCLTKFTFHVGQIVWCYWKTANEKEKAYFEANITEVWENSVAETEISSTEVDERSSGKLAVNENSEGERNFILSLRLLLALDQTCATTLKSLKYGASLQFLSN